MVSYIFFCQFHLHFPFLGRHRWLFLYHQCHFPFSVRHRELLQCHQCHFTFSVRHRELFQYHPFQYHFLFSHLFYHLHHQKNHIFAYFLCLFLHIKSCISWFAKMEFPSLTPSSAQRSVSAWNCKFSDLSQDNTSTITLLYNSVRKFFC